jgi:hypothetical protein
MPSSGLFENYRKERMNWRAPLAVGLLALVLACAGVMSLSHLIPDAAKSEGILDPFVVNDWAGQATAYRDGKVDLTYSIAMTRSGEQHNYPITFYLPTFGQAFEKTSGLKSEVLTPSPFTEAYSRITNSWSGTLIQSVPAIPHESRDFILSQAQVWEAFRYNFSLEKSVRSSKPGQREIWVPIIMAGTSVIENFSFVVSLPDLGQVEVNAIRFESAKVAGEPLAVQLPEPVWDKNPENVLILSFSSPTPLRIPSGAAAVIGFASEEPAVEVQANERPTAE